MSADMVRHLGGFDLSESAVMAVPLRAARASWRSVREGMGLSGAPRLTAEPTGSAKAEHGIAERAAVWMLYLTPSDSSGVWQMCRYASRGCREACLFESGQQGMETRAGKKETGHIARARLARTMFLGADPVSFFRIMASELDGMAESVWAEKGFALGWRPNGVSDVPFETLVPWLFERALRLDIQPYDYTAYPSSRRERSSSLVYIVDSVKETHSNAVIAAMARPVVVLDIKRGAPVPLEWRGRPTVDADLSDARWLDADGTVRVLRYKHVASCSKADALASGFVKSVA